MRQKIQNELYILKKLNKHKSLRVLINQLETLLLFDDNELNFQVKKLINECIILKKGLPILDSEIKLKIKDKNLESDAYYLYHQLKFIL